MENIGDKVGMNYGCDGSGVPSRRAKNAFKDDFAYSSSVTLDDYHIDDIRNNLKQDKPVILGGYRTKLHFLNFYWYKNGHAWVCDGLRVEYDRYKTICYSGAGVPLVSYFIKNYRYYLHMNWGNGSTSQNTWYYSNSLTQPLYSTKNYKWKKDMIINIHP